MVGFVEGPYYRAGEYNGRGIEEIRILNPPRIESRQVMYPILRSGAGHSKLHRAMRVALSFVGLVGLCLGWSLTGLAKTTVSRFCDPWEQTHTQTRVEFWLDGADWVARFELGRSPSAPLPRDSQDEAIVMAFSADTVAPVYSLEIRSSKERAEPSWEGRLRRPDGSVEGSWDIQGVTVRQEAAREVTVIQIRLPLRILDSVYGRRLSAGEAIRVALLRRSHVQNREVWSSWKFFANGSGSPWGPSAFGAIPLDAQVDTDVAVSEEPAEAKTFRLAANKIRLEIDEYLRSRALETATAAWYDQLGQFPEAKTEALLWEGKKEVFGGDSTVRMPSGGWLANPFTVCIGLGASEGTGLEFRSEDARLAGLTIELPAGEKDQARISWCSRSVPSGLCSVEAVVSFELDRSHAPEFVSISYPGTGYLPDLKVFVDDVEVPFLVMQHPGPWEIAAEFGSSNEDFGVWTIQQRGARTKALQVYRIGLTSVEAMALRPKVALLSWQEWNSTQRALWLAHYAERHDRDGGYLCESLLHYTESAQQAATRSKASKTPK